MKKLFFLLFVASIFCLSVTYVGAFTITATLTGDPRLQNPDGLKVDVVIDVTGNLASWTIDLNMAGTHPSVKLDEFYFNMAGLSGDYSFSGFNPTGWNYGAPGSVQGGGAGGSSFMFEINDPPGAPNAPDVTNAVNLTFSMTKTTGAFSTTDFLSAPSWSSNDPVLGSAQLGAHLQSLNTAGCTGCSDSGFALGNYNEGQTPVPEPATMLLLGSGLVGLAGFRKKFRKS